MEFMNNPATATVAAASPLLRKKLLQLNQDDAESAQKKGKNAKNNIKGIFGGMMSSLRNVITTILPNPTATASIPQKNSLNNTVSNAFPLSESVAVARGRSRDLDGTHHNFSNTGLQGEGQAS